MDSDLLSYFTMLGLHPEKVEITPMREIQELTDIDFSRIEITTKQCFTNAVKVMLLDPRVFYVEGIIGVDFGSILPIEHAWNGIQVAGHTIYFDITSEKLFHNDITKGSGLYYKLLEEHDLDKANKISSGVLRATALLQRKMREGSDLETGIDDDLGDVGDFEEPPVHSTETALILELLFMSNSGLRAIDESLDLEDMKSMLELLENPTLLTTLLHSDEFVASVERRLNNFKYALKEIVNVYYLPNGRRNPRAHIVDDDDPEGYIDADDGEEEENWDE